MGGRCVEFETWIIPTHISKARCGIWLYGQEGANIACHPYGIRLAFTLNLVDALSGRIVPISPHFISGLEIGLVILLCIFLITFTVDRITGSEFTGALFYDILWEVVLRNILFWCVTLWILCAAGFVIAWAAIAIYQAGSSLLKAAGAVVILRLLVWIWWRLQSVGTYDVVRNTIRTQLKKENIHGWKRFVHWWIHWGQYEGTWNAIPLFPKFDAFIKKLQTKNSST